MIKTRGKIKAWITFIFSVWMIIGLLELVHGANLESKFYYIDNIAVKVIGFFMCFFSIGLLMKKEFARKGAIIISFIGSVEILVTLDIYNLRNEDIVSAILMMTIFYIIPGVVLSLKEVKTYFNSLERELYIYEHEEEISKHLYFGKISFVFSIVNILWFIVMIAIMRYEILNWLIEEEYGNGSLTVLISVVVFLNPIFSFISAMLGAISIIKIEEKNLKVIFGTIINCAIILFYTFLIILILTIANSNVLEKIHYM